MSESTDTTIGPNVLTTLKEWLTPLSVLLLAGVMLYDRHAPTPAPAPTPAVNGEALGRAYAPLLAAGYADGWAAAAAAVDAGKPVADAQKALQDAWKASRVKAFQSAVQPGFSVVLPEGTEPADPAKRTQVAELWRAFAKGLREGK